MKSSQKKPNEYLPRWETYKNFYQITVFRYLVMWFSLVPIISGITSQLPTPMLFSIGTYTVSLDLKLPFSWQLLWLSSFLFVISLLLYHLRCPSFIKKYNNYGDYLTYHHDFRWLTWESKILLLKNIDKNKFTKRITDKGYAVEITHADEKLLQPVVNVDTTDLYFTNNDKYYKLSLPHFKNKIIENGLDDQADKGMFYEIFGRYSESRAIARITILVLVMISFILFMIVLLQHILSGLDIFIDWAKNIYHAYKAK